MRCRTWVSPALQLRVLWWIGDRPGQKFHWDYTRLNIYDYCLLSSATFRAFEPYFTAHAQKYYFRHQIGPRRLIRHAWIPIIGHVARRRFRALCGLFAYACTEEQNTTSGFRSDHAIRSGMVENLYSHEIVAKNAILGDFEPYFYCACAETARILLPVSNLTMPFDPACQKTYIYAKSWLKTRFCGYCSWMSIFALFFALEIFCACA